MAIRSSHYRQAEKLLCEGSSISGDDLDPAQLLIATLIEAQVHATLALTAATAQWPTGTADVSDWTGSGRPPQHIESDAERGICRNCGANVNDSYCSNPRPGPVKA